MSETGATHNTPGWNGLFADEMEMPFLARIGLLVNRQTVPPVWEEGSKPAKLAAVGWRILPIPKAIEAGWNGPHPATLDFRNPTGYLVQPPDDSPRAARKFPNLKAAVAWASKRAKAARKTAGRANGK
jgi:hypothetical protein